MAFSMCLNSFETFFNFHFFKLNPPCCIEEEEGSIPDYEEIIADEEDILKSFKLWISKNKPERYKFIGILINTDISSFEISLKNYIKERRHIFQIESGKDFLILHNYIENEKIVENFDIIEKVYNYITHFKISKTDLPVLVIFPYKGIKTINLKEPSCLVISLKENIKKWSGEINDYITLVFRSLFDSIEVISEDETQPVKRLKKEYNKRVKKIFGPNWNEQALNIVNMPVIGHILKLLI